LDSNREFSEFDFAGSTEAGSASGRPRQDVRVREVRGEVGGGGFDAVRPSGEGLPDGVEGEVRVPEEGCSGVLPVLREGGCGEAEGVPDEPLLARAVNLKKDAKKSAYVTKDKNGKPKVYVASSPGVEQDPKSPAVERIVTAAQALPAAVEAALKPGAKAADVRKLSVLLKQIEALLADLDAGQCSSSTGGAGGTPSTKLNPCPKKTDYDGKSLEAVTTASIEEQECLFFVALSRARDRILMYSPTKTSNQRNRARSPFVDRIEARLIARHIVPTRQLPPCGEKREPE